MLFFENEEIIGEEGILHPYIENSIKASSLIFSPVPI